MRTLLEQCVSAWHEHGPDEVETLLHAMPELAKPVRDALQTLARAGLLDDVDSSALPQRIGGYRVLSLLGRGGMGAVFRAHDDVADRDVAVKIVHQQLLWNRKARERFEREVRVLGQLEHCGAVSVYHFGEDSGVPYYVMEYVPGPSLAAILATVVGRDPARLTSRDLDAILLGKRADGDDSRRATAPWWRTVVALVAQVADTLHQAHRHGIIHRDVKPANILVTPDLSARLVDFGLARIEDEARLTWPAATLGSEPYMAPEQCGEGRHCVDARSDVFSLGATLFEALTLRTPFGNGGPQTRARILAGDHPPLCTLVPGLPRDLAAVCAVALHPDPGRRFGTAAAFAADLRNVIEGRSIAARPAGWKTRVWGLTKRHPVVVGALLASSAMLAVVPTAFAFRQHQDTRRVTAALQYAERSRDQASAAVESLLAGMAQERLFELPEAEGARRRLLEDAVAVQEAMLQEPPTGLRAGLATVNSLRVLADLHRWLGDAAAGERRCEEALAVLRSLPAGHAIAQAEVLATRAQVRAARHDHAAARADLLTAIAGLEQAIGSADAPATQPALSVALAQRRIERAALEAMAGDDRVAEAALSQALSSLRSLVLAPRLRASIARSLLEMTRFAASRGNVGAATEAGKAAVAAYDEVLAVDADHWELAAARAAARSLLGKVLLTRSDLDGAGEHAALGHEELVGLRAKHPSVDWLSFLLADAKVALADVLRARQREGDARDLLDAAIAMLRALARREPQAAAYRETLAIAIGARAVLAAGVKEAAPMLEEAKRLLEPLLAANPASPTLWQQFTATRMLQASLRRSEGDLDGEGHCLDEAIAIMRQRLLPGRAPTGPAPSLLSTMLLDRADCAARAGDADRAHEFLVDAMAVARVQREHAAARQGLADLLATPRFQGVFR